MLYYSKINVKDYYQKQKIMSELNISEKGFLYKNITIPFSETTICCNDKKYLIYPKYPYQKIVLGELKF